MTFEEAIESAARVLRAAEMETNLNTMERLEKLADSWVNLAHVINARESVG